MSDPTMVYKPSPEGEILHGYAVEWTIVESEEVEAMLADGWHRTPTEAGLEVRQEAEQNAADMDQMARPILEAKAKELGIKFDGRTSTKTLDAKIKALE